MFKNTISKRKKITNWAACWKKYQWIEDRFQKTMQIEAQTVKKKKNQSQ